MEEKIQQDFGIEVSNLKNAEHAHVDNDVLIGSDIVVRMAKQSPSRFPTEVWGYSAFREHEIPSPDVISYQEDPPHIGRPTIILSKVPGEILAKIPLTQEEEEAYFVKAGELLRSIHAIHVDGFGHLRISNGEAQGKNETWKEYWENRQKDKQFDDLFNKGIISPSEHEALAASHSLVQSRPLEKASFLHNDYHSKNILIKEGEISGVIDLCNAFAGDPLYDLATALFFQTQEQQAAFLKGYGDNVDQEALRQNLIFISGLKIASRLATGREERAMVAKEKLQTLLQV